MNGGEQQQQSEFSIVRAGVDFKGPISCSAGRPVGTLRSSHCDEEAMT